MGRPGTKAGSFAVWWRRRILGQPFPKWTKWLFVCCCSPWFTRLQYAILICSCLSLGLPIPKEGWRGGQGKWKKGEERSRRGEGREEGRRRVQEERREKGCGLSPGCSPSHPPFPPLHRPLPPSPSLAASLYTMAASLLKFHVIGSRAWSFVLPQCPGSRACCRGDTLCKLKAGKPFLLSLASEKGRKVPPTFFFPPSLLFLAISLVSKPEKSCQAQSSSTRPLWLEELLRGRKENH